MTEPDLDGPPDTRPSLNHGNGNGHVHRYSGSLDVAPVALAGGVPPMGTGSGSGTTMPSKRPLQDDTERAREGNLEGAMGLKRAKVEVPSSLSSGQISPAKYENSAAAPTPAAGQHHLLQHSRAPAPTPSVPPPSTATATTTSFLSPPTSTHTPTVFQIPRPRSPSPLPPQHASTSKQQQSTSIGNSASPATASATIAAAAAVTTTSTLSRNSSPAPSTQGGDGKLIELIKSSLIVDSEKGTKVELCRFVDDPKSYPASGPLLTRPYWVFELRRLTTSAPAPPPSASASSSTTATAAPVPVATTTKVDVIIVRSLERTYQLKRAALDIVTSWGIDKSVKEPCVRGAATATTSHAPSAMTSPTQAPATAPASSPASVNPLPVPPPLPHSSTPASATPFTSTAPTPLSISSMPRADLESLYSTLLSTHASTLSLLTSYQALSATPSTLSQSLKQLRSLSSAKEDFQYMQVQYQSASNAAVLRAEEARVAEEEVTRLKEVVRVGLEQRKKFWESQVDVLKGENGRLKGELKLVKEQSRRSGEREIREKASRWDDWVAEQERREREEREGVSKDEDDDDENEVLREAKIEEDGLRIESSEKVLPCEWRAKEGECGIVFRNHQDLRNHLIQDHVPPVISRLA